MSTTSRPATMSLQELEPRRAMAGRILLGISLMLIAFNLRPLFASLSVLLPELIQDGVLRSAAAGYLTTLPVLCLGLFAPLAPRLNQAIGPERSLLLALVLIGLGTGLRGLDHPAWLFIGTAVAGAAIAVGNVLLPSVVKRDFADRSAMMTGLYTMALCGGAATAAAVTIPLMTSLAASWQTGLAMWAIPAIVVALLWAPQCVRLRIAVSGRSTRVVGLRRDPLAWQVTFFMGLQSAIAYCVLGWMAPILQARGLDGVQAGILTSVSIMLQVISCLFVPSIAVRFRDQRLIGVFLALLAAASLSAMLFAPPSTLWIWAVLQGIGQGGLFALAMLIIVLRSPDSQVAAHLSGMAQGIGYILAALGPLLMGIIRDATGNYDATVWLLAFIGVAGAVNGWGAGRNLRVNARVVHAAEST